MYTTSVGLKNLGTGAVLVKPAEIINRPFSYFPLLYLGKKPSSGLGVTRDYWLAVKFDTSSSEDAGKADDNGAADVIESKKMAEDKKMAKTTYTEEQLSAALERAAEVGIHKAAEEGGVSWQSLQAYAKKQGKLEEVSLKKKASAKKAATTATKQGKKAEKPKVEPVAEAAPEATPVAEEKAPTKRTKKEKVTPAAAPTPAPTEEKKAASALEIENAVLRKENEQLKSKIEKLQKALAELM